MTDLGGNRYLSFLTDYGTLDGFVAICHGQMLRHAPHVRVIDITHEIAPGNVRRGATVLAETLPELPPGGVHVGVVDPGVGTRRRSVAIAAGGHVLVGPDNGLLPWAADALGGAEAVWELTNEDLWRRPVSATFHGRDVYAPVAARIAAGLSPAETGERIPPESLVRLPPPRRSVTAGTALGEVRAVDRFGNCQLSLRGDDMERLVPGGTPATVEAALPCGVRELPVTTTFGAVPEGRPLLFVDSAGYAALAVNGGDAAAVLGLTVGDHVTLRAGGRSRPGPRGV
ncbi:SAM hydrolase/SAM-dependent halogenase family protein [Marinactinospora thermotolerans]|uniref:SAM-dependent chlorinase/fluorinase n=1 Tax=Marinactinospora thermotolerans DSM 45154 TaxID=1122192 RepID=A0A1T4MYB9_9ACTN|nr:SAM-dependent chlorinase/fluorinase [Marinactinospora thermotolerans]SJZ71992.1 hypothetical protein SAMN02745673_01193 [Marinactinospora thermotolerans DSM 45154]